VQSSAKDLCWASLDQIFSCVWLHGTLILW
jgi:hypothetical protein